MEHKILLVDDEVTILSAYSRIFRNKFNMETALGVDEALEAIQFKSKFSVVISDYEMGKVKGIEFLAKVKELSPDTVCIMLTGHADFTVAMDALNEGNVFRFLTKPCDSKVFEKVILDGIKQYELIMADKELAQLKGFLAMCCNCKKIRDGKGEWHTIESYIETHSTAQVSHSYCPD